ncbi:MAG: hypothetical protein ITD40_02265 [Nitrosarchaeum sp.]|nr:hypothetical protein [Nitrosarchaeum sp.]
MKVGRPSSDDHEKIRNKIENYYFKGLSVRNTAKLLNLNKNTVSVQYLKIEKERDIIIEDNFEKRVIKDKNDADKFYENLMDEIIIRKIIHEEKLEKIQLNKKTHSVYKLIMDIIQKCDTQLIELRIIKTNNYLTLSEGQIIGNKIHSKRIKQ